MSTREVEKRVQVVESDGTPEGDERGSQSRWQALAQVARWLERPLHHEDELADAGYRVVTRDQERGASVDPIALEIARDDVAAAKRDAAREAQAAKAKADEVRERAWNAKLEKLFQENHTWAVDFLEARDEAEWACAVFLARLLVLREADRQQRRVAESIERLTGEPPAGRPSRVFFGEAMRIAENNPLDPAFYRGLSKGALPPSPRLREVVERIRSEFLDRFLEPRRRREGEPNVTSLVAAPRPGSHVIVRGQQAGEWRDHISNHVEARDRARHDRAPAKEEQ